MQYTHVACTRVRAEAKAAVNMELSPLQLLDPKTVAPLGDMGTVHVLYFTLLYYEYNSSL